MSKETVLVIEDEKNIRELVVYNLEREGFKVQSAARGDLGLAEAQKSKPDLIILDLMLPALDGLEICKILRRKPETASIPIVMLTAKTEETEKIIGLELGADDYITKPFSPRELVARVKAILRRVKEKPIARFSVGDLMLDPERHLVTLKGRTLDLTSKEFELLKAFMEANGRVLTRESLLERIWGYDVSANIETRTVDMHVGQLRKKLKTEGKKIATVKNAGYRFDV